MTPRPCATLEQRWGACREPDVYAINHPAARSGAHVAQFGVCNPWREVVCAAGHFERHEVAEHVEPCTGADP